MKSSVLKLQNLIPKNSQSNLANKILITNINNPTPYTLVKSSYKTPQIYKLRLINTPTFRFTFDFTQILPTKT